MDGYNTSQVPQLFTFRPSPEDKNVTLIQGEGHNAPLYTVTISKPSRFNVRLSRVFATSIGLQQTNVGDASFDALSSTVYLTLRDHLTLHDQCIEMKPSTWLDKQTFTYCARGQDAKEAKQMQWQSNFMGTKLKLFDISAKPKRIYAQYKVKSSRSGGSTLELFDPCEDIFLYLVILSAAVIPFKESEDAKLGSKIAADVSG